MDAVGFDREARFRLITRHEPTGRVQDLDPKLASRGIGIDEQPIGNRFNGNRLDHTLLVARVERNEAVAAPRGPGNRDLLLGQISAVSCGDGRVVNPDLVADDDRRVGGSQDTPGVVVVGAVGNHRNPMLQASPGPAVAAVDELHVDRPVVRALAGTLLLGFAGEAEVGDQPQELPAVRKARHVIELRVEPTLDPRLGVVNLVGGHHQLLRRPVLHVFAQGQVNEPPLVAAMAVVELVEREILMRTGVLGQRACVAAGQDRVLGIERPLQSVRRIRHPVALAHVSERLVAFGRNGFVLVVDDARAVERDGQNIVIGVSLPVDQAELGPRPMDAIVRCGMEQLTTLVVPHAQLPGIGIAKHAPVDVHSAIVVVSLPRQGRLDDGLGQLTAGMDPTHYTRAARDATVVHEQLRFLAQRSGRFFRAVDLDLEDSGDVVGGLGDLELQPARGHGGEPRIATLQGAFRIAVLDRCRDMPCLAVRVLDRIVLDRQARPVGEPREDADALDLFLFVPCQGERVRELCIGHPAAGHGHPPVHRVRGREAVHRKLRAGRCLCRSGQVGHGRRTRGPSLFGHELAQADLLVQLIESETDADDRVLARARLILDIRRGHERAVGQGFEPGVAAIAAGVTVEKLDAVLPVATTDDVRVTAHPGDEVVPRRASSGRIAEADDQPAVGCVRRHVTVAA